MSRVLLLVLALMVVLSVPGLAAQQTPTASDLPFEIIDTSPLDGEEISLEEPLILFFDRPVNCDSAQDAISISPAVEGSLTCDDVSVTFTPSAAYPTGTQITLTAGTGLQALDGTSLAEPVTLAWPTPGDLAVTEVLPDEGTTGVEADAVITVIFNRPVVPLVSNEDRDTLPDPLIFDPAVEGEGEWLNTSIYVFRPDPALAGGTTYTVTVEAGLTAVDGATLENPFSWTFTTVNPAIVETIPADLASGISLDESIQVVFNQPMDRASVEASFYVRPQGQTTGTVEGSFEWSEDSTGFRFTPSDNLNLDTLYTAGFDQSEIRAASVDAPLRGQTEWDFVTIPEPGVTGTDPFDGETGVDVFSGITIFFASPMNQETLEDNITIEPEPLREPSFYYYEYDNSYHISLMLEPSAEYTLTIEPGMEDIYGNVIDRTRTIRFTTAPYSPLVELQAPRGVATSARWIFSCTPSR